MHLDSIYDDKFVRDLFNNVSSSYDKVNGFLTLGLSSFIRNYIIKTKLGKSQDAIKVLDIMSGNGESWERIMKQFPNCHITAVDYSERMVANAQLKNNSHFKNRITVINANVLNSSLDSNTYDLIVCAFGLKHFNNHQVDIISKETFRLLKSGGRFVFFDISKPGNKIVLIPFSLFFKFILPFFSKIYTHNYSSYKLLWQYLHKFNNCANANELFVYNGLRSRFQQHFLGMVSSIQGYK